MFCVADQTKKLSHFVGDFSINWIPACAGMTHFYLSLTIRVPSNKKNNLSQCARILPQTTNAKEYLI